VWLDALDGRECIQPDIHGSRSRIAQQDPDGAEKKLFSDPTEFDTIVAGCSNWSTKSGATASRPADAV
jgi:hypothetical protein